ncbi:MAG: Molybdenum cofactor guanylyltransferase [Syntrophus sp. SKADARSKE-3]|nr:Molybdenum cofactor guanylyltransferase [Syntrophus sp. SKADARSKE-3]MDQ5987691.1 Molybdenum cofactor guanylyltransferase [Syntrophus sp. SKADARSKE-3]
MRTNKAFLRLCGERLIDRTVRIYRSIFSEIILVTNEPLLYLDQNVTIVTDLVKNKGPLMGIYTGLFHAASDKVFVAAGDMPFLNSELIKYMINDPEDADVFVPISKGNPEPLHAVYSKKCMKPIRRLLDSDRLKVTGFFKDMKQKVIGEDVLERFDSDGRMFANINTPDEYNVLC